MIAKNSIGGKWTVRVTTTTLGGDLSYGAKLQITASVYMFDSLPAARACLEVEKIAALRLDEWPGVIVEVSLDSMPDEGRMDAASLRGE